MVRNECVIKMVPGERYTPFSLAQRLKARVILESSSFQKGRERYSVLMIREAFRLIQDQRGIVFVPAGSGRSFRVDSRARDILDVCRYFADQQAPVHQDFPFPAGGVGYLSFEFARFCDNIQFAEQEDSLGMPDAAFLFGHTFVVFDHYTDKLILIGINYREAQINLQEELDALEARILAGGDASKEKAPAPIELALAEPVTSLSDSDSEYMSRVDAVREEVIAGNLLQAVPSRRLTLESDIEPMEAYRRLRSSNPSPYLFFIDFNQYQLIGASPEVHVKIKDGKAILRPIAGTRRRGASKSEDLALEAEMLADPKERAEHLMLVDLGRNDLGRVCQPGSVKVTEYMVTERYSHVMHMVSQVEGQLVEGRSGIDVFRATFPAGTVSGAPKISAIEILSRIERFQRRSYAGAIGYLEPGGNMDTCIGIRTALKKGKHLILQAGAGVVYDSTPERELEETREKLGATANAFGVRIESRSPASVASPPRAGADGEDAEVVLGYSGSGGSTQVSRPGNGASAVAKARQSRQTPAWQEDGGTAKQIQDQIDSMIGASGMDEAGEIVLEESLPADFMGNGAPLDAESDPWADADAEAELLSAGNRPPPQPEEEIIPLDWDFDPATATGATEIQDEIDILISADETKESEGGRG